MTQTVRWHRFSDAEAVAGETVRRILTAAQAAVQARGVFRMVLAGGSTPQRAYRALAENEADWSRWHLYFGDERCLPADHADRNSVMVFDAWLNRGQVPSQQVFPIPAEMGAEQGASSYEDLIRAAVPFDLVLLGMGEDGHTASLFPGQVHDAERLVVPVHRAPKPPSDRVSLNYGALANTRSLLVLVTGAGKREALGRWQSGGSLPVAHLQCQAGIDVLLDQEASNG